MTTIITRGAASAQALGYATSSLASPSYVEDVFSTYLYAGNGGTQTITNGIDLSTKGGMTWIKSRSAPTNHFLFDTSRGALNEINSNTTDAQASLAASLTAFNTTGFSLGGDAGVNKNGETFVSWTFEEQLKFFDVLTYTGTGSNRTVSHNLGAVPGCILIKRTDTTGAWQVYHGSLANTEYMVLNTTAAKATGATRWNSTTPTSTEFSLGTDVTVNASGGTYVAYLFAHNAGGFGDNGTDNVISCGSYTGTGVSGLAVSLGYEPQFLLIKRADAVGAWLMYDTTRGMGINFVSYTVPNTNNADATLSTSPYYPTPTGFVVPTGVSNYNANGGIYLYIAIRRGPMRTPTSSTTVFSPNAVAISGQTTVTTGFPVDMSLTASTDAGTSDRYLTDRVRSPSLTIGNWLLTNATSVQAAQASGQSYASNTGIVDDIWNGFVTGTPNVIFWNFRRAPGFFEVLTYTGTGTNTTQAHGLGVVPEMIWVKRRITTAAAWAVYSSSIANTEYLTLNTTAAKATGATRWNSTTPTSSVFSLGTDATVNANGGSYMAYMFATVAGVSKVGSYTGNGTSQTINCGFAAGSRFVMIKRTDSTGNWTVFDSARGIVAGNDPAININDNVAQVTTIDAVDTNNSGFIVNQDATLNLNVNAATYTFLAIA